MDRKARVIKITNGSKKSLVFKMPNDFFCWVAEGSFLIVDTNNFEGSIDLECCSIEWGGRSFPVLSATKRSKIKVEYL